MTNNHSKMYRFRAKQFELFNVFSDPLKMQENRQILKYMGKKNKNNTALLFLEKDRQYFLFV